MQTVKTEPLLLDTHAWIWLSIGDREKIRPSLFKKIEEAAENNILRISAISCWEIAVLHRKGRLRLSEDPFDWIRTTLRLTRVQSIPLTFEIAVESELLPGNFHGDPADRMIVASARASQSLLVTADRAIQKYCENGYLKVLPCG
jgi:PIN domain nuclease of toxin-antitoxin system